MEKIKEIPYGISDFEEIQSLNMYYVDKTHFIPAVEKYRFVYLLRPRRFGKSLFVSMLVNYFDILQKDRFEELFHDTWILSNPTEYQGKYFILYLNFSEGLKGKGNFDEIFLRFLEDSIDIFFEKYESFFTQKVFDDLNKAKYVDSKFNVIRRALMGINKKLYIIIDEYDNFTNTLLTNFETEEYKRITRQAGLLKQFFTNLKAYTSGPDPMLQRVFITGVSPVTMDDIASGFNIAHNMTLQPKTNDILGFNEKEVREVLSYYLEKSSLNVDKEEVMKTMKIWYDNYYFAEDAETAVFNSDAVLYFVKEITDKGKLPSDLIDENLRFDYGKLRSLVLYDNRLNGNFSLLSRIINDNGVLSKVLKSFPFDSLTNEMNFMSWLYYLGLLTFSGKFIYHVPYLTIPNETIRKIVFEYIQEVLKSGYKFTIDMPYFTNMLNEMAYEGKFKPLFEFIAEGISKNTSIRDYINSINSEQMVKLFYLKDLILFDTYIVQTEQELNKGYTDLFLVPFKEKYADIKYAYLIEFKYVKRGEKGAKSLVKKLAEEAKSQLGKYAIDDNMTKRLGVAPHGNVELKKIAIVFHGWELAYCEEI